MLKKHYRFAVGLAMIVPLGAMAYCLAILLRFDGQLDAAYPLLMASTLGGVLAVKTLIICLARLHQEYTRYVSFRDMLVLTRTATLCTIGIVLVDAMLLTSVTIPRSVVLLDWGVTLALLAAARTMPRLLRDHLQGFISAHTGTRVIIIGANDAGEALLHSIRKQSDVLCYKPIGFVDDRHEVRGRRIAGVPVLGNYADLAELASRHSVKEVLLTAGSLPGKKIRELTEQAQQHGFRLKILPSYEQLLQEQVAIQPRQVAIADLLQRPAVALDTQKITQWIGGHTVFVTGSAGSIGSEICRQVLKLSPKKLVVIDRSETGQFFLERELQRLTTDTDIAVELADLNDLNRLDAVFSLHQPHIVFHAAAYKHVPLMEAHVGEAVKNIVLATQNVVDLAEEHGVEGLVMISTDKAVNPTSVMGSCKRLAEQYVQAKAKTSSCRLVTVRFGNVLDSAGSVVPIFREQIARGGPVTVTHPEMIRYFMLIPEAAQLVVQAGAMGRGGEIFVLDMGEPVRIIDLARDMIRLSGLRVGDDIEIEVTGLRPGEKMYEELYSDMEAHRPTSHKKIMVAASKPRHLLSVINEIAGLRVLADGPNEQVRAALDEIIPVQKTASRLPNSTRAAA
ncbi:MAG: polysaccharide biosynthesis protein [Pirellulales bacterium]|nr:polysaccharide biosynthesis protein [Pirellulales bacterium]